ncbi:MAG: outer membrane beta-barrel protein [Candidatus Symbiothrix sp.]|jgi:hypothetical protein|nr:outer membrane beta-barrel protein [Candidatus Symbiothrix sp.]
MKIQVSLILLSIVSIYCSAQELRLKGHLADENNSPVASAYLLFLKEDSVTEINAALSEENGHFSILLPERGKYLVHVYHVSHGDHLFPVMISDSIINLELKNENYILPEVIIKSSFYIKAMTFKDGDLLFSPSLLGNTTTNDALALLRNLPSVEISSTGEILLNGHPVTININGRNRNYPPSALQAFLKSLPADQIKEIIIKQMSSAENQASGRGSIDIITKKFDSESALLNVGSNINLIHNKWDGSENIFYAIRKQNLYLDTSLGYGNKYSESKTKSAISYPNGRAASGSTNNYGRYNNYSGNVNMELDLQNNNKINASFMAYLDNAKRNIHSNYNYFNNNIVLEKSTDAGKRRVNEDLYASDIEFISNDTLQYRHKIKYGVVWGSSKNITNMKNLTEINEFTAIYNTKTENEHKGIQHQIQYDFTYIASALTEVKFGTRMDLGRLFPQTDFDSIVNNTPIHSALLSSKYDINENVFAAYTSLRHILSDKFTVYVGARGEYTDLSAKSVYDKISADYGKFHIFPYAYLSGNFQRFSSTIRLSSGVSRPSFLYYVPNYRYVSKYRYTVGNPNLKPERYYAVSLTNMIFDFININLTYTQTKDKVRSVTQSVNNNYEEKTTYLNICDENRFTYNLKVPFEFFKKKMFGFFSVYAYNSKFTDFKENITLKNNSGKGMTFINHLQYNILTNLSLGYDLKYQSKCYFEQSISDPFYYLNLNASCDIKYFSIGFTAGDVLNSAALRKSILYHGDNLTNNEVSYWQRFGFVVRYKFSTVNKIKVKDSRGVDISRFKE